MMKILFVFLLGSVLFFGFQGSSVFAVTNPSDLTGGALGNLQNAGAGAQLGDANTAPASAPELIGRIIQQLLIVIGVVFLVLVFIGGIIWMTAGGSEDQIAKGRKLLVNAAIGLGITVGAYAITQFVFAIVIRSGQPTFLGI